MLLVLRGVGLVGSGAFRVRSVLDGVCDVAEKNRAIQMSKQEAIKRVEAALDTMRYGEIIIKVQDGRPLYVDKYERERIGGPKNN